MKRHFTDEKTGIRYTLQGDYYLPDLALPAEEQQPIGIWGQRHRRYLKAYYRVRYYNLRTDGMLNQHLSEGESQTQQLFDMLARKVSEEEDLTEKLKEHDLMEWIRRNNNIRK